MSVVYINFSKEKINNINEIKIYLLDASNDVRLEMKADKTKYIFMVRLRNA